MEELNGELLLLADRDFEGNALEKANRDLTGDVKGNERRLDENGTWRHQWGLQRQCTGIF